MYTSEEDASKGERKLSEKSYKFFLRLWKPFYIVATVWCRKVFVPNLRPISLYFNYSLEKHTHFNGI